MQSGIDIIVPFHENDGLVAPLFDSLAACAAELRLLGAAVVAVNDAPGHGPLDAALRAAVARLHGAVPVTVVVNDENLGFVRSCNRGLARAVAAGRDALLLNSDTVVLPGAIGEMVRVAGLDPMIGFVSPRSNNATIASLPVQEEHRQRPLDEAHAAFLRLSRHLPDFHYVPTGVGFCLLVRSLILREFGLLDEAYGQGYNEENDLVMRANRCGYRAVIANRAFVYHRGGTSFSPADRGRLEERNARLLAERFPEYPRAVHDYLDGPVYQAEAMLSSLLPDAAGRHDLLFDLSDLGSYHNGTIEAALALVRAFAAKETGRFNLFVIMHAEHARYHGIDALSGVRVLPVDTDRRFAVGFRVGQPFTVESYVRLDRLAVRTVWFMLDSITWDCLCLVNPDLDWIWRQVFEHADAIVYNSDFTRRQFAARFPAAPAVRHLVSPHGLDPAEYLPPGRHAGLPGEHVLVVGNAFPHKHVGPMVDALVRAVPNARIVCLGLPAHPHPLVACRPGGHVSVDEMESLYERARVVVFPSHYEGFGFPVLKALAYRKPIVARDCVLARDLKSSLGDDPNVILRGTTDEMAAVLRDSFPSWVDVGAAAVRRGWDDSRREIAALLGDLVEAEDAWAGLVRRRAAAWAAAREAARTGVRPSGTSGEIVEVDPSLPEWLRRIRSRVIEFPPVRAIARPFWRVVWRAVRWFLDD
ncbi:MAG: glycosyltransferase [Planctomycetia bacterium]|nr:glycosyltransferase [Planctomycetia bacterium]